MVQIKLQFYRQKRDHGVVVLGVKRPNDPVFYKFRNQDQNLKSHPLEVQQKLVSCLTTKTSAISVSETTYHLYFRNDEFFFKFSPLQAEATLVNSPLKIRVQELAKKKHPIDKNALKSMVFKPGMTDPVDFLKKFDDCFDDSILSYEKAVSLINFVPVVERYKYDEIWIVNKDLVYEKFKSIFIDNYSGSYLIFKNERVGLKHSDFESLEEFSKVKIDVYKRLENMSEHDAVEKVVHELPPSICSSYLADKIPFSKDRLLILCKANDLRMRSVYNSLNRQMVNASLNDSISMDSSNSGTNSIVSSSNQSDSRSPFKNITDRMCVRKSKISTPKADQPLNINQSGQHRLDSSNSLTTAVNLQLPRKRGRPKKSVQLNNKEDTLESPSLKKAKK